MRPLHWKLGIAAALVVLASGGLVIAQSQTPPQDPTTETPPQEPPPKDVPTPPVQKVPEIVAPAETAPEIKAPDDSGDKDENSDDNDKSSDKDKKGEDVKAADPTAVETEPPGIRARHAGAVIQALDKITAETMRFEVPVGKPVRYKDVVFTVRSCETSSPEETLQDSMAYVEVRSEPKLQNGEQTSHRVFSGWMFASSPGLDALQHPVYDAWLIACKA
jgi:hypothetical protein